MAVGGFHPLAINQHPHGFSSSLKIVLPQQS
jgi:hypothetical protein